MALLCFIFLGCLIGWMAAIITRTEEPAAIRRDIGTGLIGSLVAGLIANNGAFLGGFGWPALVAAIGGGIVLAAIAKVIFSRRSA